MSGEAEARQVNEREREWIRLSHDFSTNLEGLFGLVEQFDYVLAAYVELVKTANLSRRPSEQVVRQMADHLIEQSRRVLSLQPDDEEVNSLKEGIALLKQGLRGKDANLTSLWQGATTIWNHSQSPTSQSRETEQGLSWDVLDLCVMLCRLIIAQQKPRLISSHADALAFRIGADPPNDLPSVDIREILQEAIDSIQPFATQRQIEIRPAAGATILTGGMVSVDRVSIVSALKALLDNAVKYNWPTKSGLGWVNVRAKASFRTVMVQIESWGTPIDQVEIDTGAVFRRGYRGRYAEREGISGTGTGLAFAKEIIETKHYGQLMMETRVDKKSWSKERGYPNITTVTVHLQRVG